MITRGEREAGGMARETGRMRFQISAWVLGLGIAISTFTAIGAAVPSSANGTASCIATTGTFVQAVGFPGAPVLVPMSLPVTVCTLPTNVQVIIPAFRSLSVQTGSVIVPRALPVASCASSLVAVSFATRGTVPVLQVAQGTGSTVVVLPSMLPATVVTPLIACF